MFSAGSYDKTIGIYDERQKSILSCYSGHNGGITHLKFSASGFYLFSGARKDREIHCWDIRKQSILFSMKRNVDTHQRVLFDLDSIQHRYLVTGSRNEILFYELAKMGEDPIVVNVDNTMVNATVFHPLWPILATSSGERKFYIKDVQEEGEALETQDQVNEPDVSIWRCNVFDENV